MADNDEPPNYLDDLGDDEEYEEWNREGVERERRETEDPEYQEYLDDPFGVAHDEVVEEAMERHRAAEMEKSQAWEAAFCVRDPKPERNAPPREEAAWEWRREEMRLYEGLPGTLPQLAYHRARREVWIAERARTHARSRQYVDGWMRPLKAAGRAEIRNPRPDPDPESFDADDPFDWNELDDLRVEDDDPDELEKERAAMLVPAYVAAKRLDRAMYAWWRSLPRAAYDAASACHQSGDKVEFEVSLALHSGFRPRHVGRHVLRLMRALAHAEAAQEALDALLPEPWLVPKAYTRLSELIEAARVAVADRLAEVRLVQQAMRAAAGLCETGIGPDGTVEPPAPPPGAAGAAQAGTGLP